LFFIRRKPAETTLKTYIPQNSAGISLVFWNLLAKSFPMKRGGKVKGRANLTRKVKRKNFTKRKLAIVLCIAVLLAGLASFVWIHFHSPKPSATTTTESSPFKQPRTLKELLALSPAQLDQCDIGLMNLLCAYGLPGAEDLNVDECLKTLDGWTQRVSEETQRHEYRFNEHPEQFRNSLGYYRMMMLGTVLVQDLGIQYNPDLALPQMDGQRPTMASGTDSKDIFIHGLLNGNHYGTCASMPVLVVAIGRRLGYPVNLAGAKLHLYARYEDYNGKHFNVEPTVTEGFFTPSDDDYKSGNGRFPATDEEIKEYGWLRPLSNKEALSEFLDNRGICLGDANRYDEARQMFILSASYAPDTPLRRQSLQTYLEELKNAPLGDKINDWRAEIISWDVPQDARYYYFENRKTQIRYFVGICPDAAASQQAVDDLKAELAEYRRQMTLANPAPEFLNHGQHILDLTSASGQELRTPTEALPPPLNNGTTPQDYLNCIAHINLQDEGAVLDAFWQHYKDVTVDWSNQPPLLPQKMEMPPISSLTGQ
jgi:hypothetical protein